MYLKHILDIDCSITEYALMKAIIYEYLKIN